MIKINNLNVRFKNVHAVRGVNLEIKEGETVAIVGESGSGKSALAKSLVKLFPKKTAEFSGEVIYNGKNILEFSEKELRKVRGKEIGMIFQDPMTSLNPLLTVGFQIRESYLRHFPEKSRKDAVKRTEELLDLVGIPKDRMDHYPHTLSGGMRQRALIALALAASPKLLIADEPTTALDVTLQAQILDLLKDIQQKLDMSILLITHDLSVVAGFCDRVLVMYAGKIIESAPVDQIFETPQHPYTRRLLLSKPRLDMPQNEPLHPIEGTPPDLGKSITGCSFCPRCTDSIQACKNESPPIFTITPGHTTSCWLSTK